jgi:hypothetical protein
LIVMASSDALARTWYVAPDGLDDAEGTEQAPFATWQRAIDEALPGDTILVRAGTYVVQGTQGVRIARSGRPDAPVTLRSTGGRALLDCSEVPSEAGLACLHLLADWWVLREVDITRARQGFRHSWSIGVLIEDASNNRLDQVASYENEGTGILVTGSSSNNRLVNCDSYRNVDRLTRPPGGDADGIGFKFLPPSAQGNEIVACRTWANSDDGVDLWHAEAPVTIRSSWAFWNGYLPGSAVPAGDGVGFKLGRNETGPRHRIIGSLSLENRYAGFDSNGAAGPIEVLDSAAIDNGMAGFVFPEPGHRLSDLALAGNPAWEDHQEEDASTVLPPSIVRCIAGSREIDGPRRTDGSLPHLGCGWPTSSD